VIGISDIIVKPGLINVDFADVRSVMGGAGTALMGIGRGRYACTYYTILYFAYTASQ
jgi:cell division GTPase FtsZ